jgi:TolB protein
MKRRLAWLFGAALAVLMFWGQMSTSEAQLEIDIDPSRFQKFPIAVAPLKVFAEKPDEAGLAAAGQQVIMQDLDIAGFFQVLDPRGFLEDSATAGIDVTHIDFNQWLQVGADYLVKGGMWIKEDGSLKLDMRLFDVAKSREVLQKTYETDKDGFRARMHDFANRIVEFFTKESGVFATKIVSIRKVDGRKQIYLMDFDGFGGQVILDNGSINLLPAFSPDGAWIYFTSYMNNNPDLYRMQPFKGGKILKVSSYRGLNVGATASPDGSLIAVTLSIDGNSEIYVMNADGAARRRITHSHAIDSSPSWAPDNRTLVFVSDRSGYPQLYKADIGGGQPVRLTFQGNYNQSPAWSPKGDKIVFCARDERLVFDLFAVDPETRVITRLTQDEGNNEDPAWSPDGHHIVFTSTRNGGVPKLFIMNEDGSGQRQISQGPGEFGTPDWSPRFTIE